MKATTTVGRPTGRRPKKDDALDGRTGVERQLLNVTRNCKFSLKPHNTAATPTIFVPQQPQDVPTRGMSSSHCRMWHTTPSTNQARWKLLSTQLPRELSQRAAAGWLADWLHEEQKQ